MGVSGSDRHVYTSIYSIYLLCQYQANSTARIKQLHTIVSGVDICIVQYSVVSGYIQDKVVGPIDLFIHSKDKEQTDYIPVHKWIDSGSSGYTLGNRYNVRRDTYVT